MIFNKLPMAYQLDIKSNQSGQRFSGTITPSSYAVSAYLGTPIAADDDRIVTTADWANGSLTVAAQPDTPRNLTCTLTDANSSITGGTLTITGLDPAGNQVVETITVAQAVAGFTGTKIFASVSTAVISATAGTPASGTDTLIIGVGNVIGLPSDVSETSAIKHVYLGGTRVASPTLAAGTQASGVNVSASTYNGTKALIVLYRP